MNNSLKERSVSGQNQGFSLFSKDQYFKMKLSLALLALSATGAIAGRPNLSVSVKKQIFVLQKSKICCLKNGLSRRVLPRVAEAI